MDSIDNRTGALSRGVLPGGIPEAGYRKAVLMFQYMHLVSGAIYNNLTPSFSH